MEIQIDMYQTLALSVVVLMLGQFLKQKINFLEKFCIPSPVVGGLIFSVLTCILYSTGVVEFTFDDTLREVCMVFFFTSVGFQANLKVLKSGGKALAIFLGLVIVLIFMQNLLAVGVSHLIGLDSLVGLCTGSIPMVGGHGTAGAFGPVLEDFNVQGATTICTAAATFGLVAGSLIGGPIGKRLIEKKHLLDTIVTEDDSLLIEEEKKHERHSNMYAAACVSADSGSRTRHDHLRTPDEDGPYISDLYRSHDRRGDHSKCRRVFREIRHLYGRDQQPWWYLSVAFPWNCDDHIEAVAARRACITAYDLARGAASAYIPVHIFCCIPCDGKGL